MSLIDSIKERINYFWGSDSSENQEKNRTPAQESASQATQHNQDILERKKAEPGLQRNIQELCQIKKITQDNFKEAIEKGIILVDFYANWCRHCPSIIPILEKVAAELQGQATIVKLDTDKAPEIVSTHRLKGVPTLILFRDGKEVGRLMGIHKTEVIKAFILSAKK